MIKKKHFGRMGLRRPLLTFSSKKTESSFFPLILFLLLSSLSQRIIRFPLDLLFWNKRYWLTLDFWCFTWLKQNPLAAKNRSQHRQQKRATAFSHFQQKMLTQNIQLLHSTFTFNFYIRLLHSTFTFNFYIQNKSSNIIKRQSILNSDFNNR